MRKLVVLLSLSILGLFACSSGELGESCEESGKVSGECDDGLVCGKKSSQSNDLVCLKQCSSQAECGATEACNGVSGSSLKGCQQKAQ